MSNEDYPDINDTLRDEGDDAVRKRFDEAHRRRKAAEQTNGQHGGTGRASGSGEDEREAWERANGRTRSGKQSRIRLVAFDDIKLGRERRYLIKGIIPRTGLIVVWGPPKSGKSFWTFDLVMHCVLNRAYRGRRVHPGAVVYCAFEGQTGIEARCAAFRQKFLPADHEPVPFYLEPVTLNLVRDARELTIAVRYTLGEVKPVAIVLDTLNRSLHGSESSDEDMTAYIRAADSLREAFDCAVIIVHHCGIDGSRPRGHTSLTGAVEAQLAVSRDAADNIIVTLEYAKDAPQGDTVTSRLEVVEVGTDEDGDPMTSCVVVPAEGAAAPAGRAGSRLTANQNRFLDILRDAVLDAPSDHKTTYDIHGGRTAITREWLKMCCISKGWLEDDGGNKNRAKFSEMINTLAGKRVIGTTKLFVWIAQ